MRFREGVQWKAAFNTPLGHFEYQEMSFDPTNTPAIIQILIIEVRRDMYEKFVFVYLAKLLKPQ